MKRGFASVALVSLLLPASQPVAQPALELLRHLPKENPPPRLSEHRIRYGRDVDQLVRLTRHHEEGAPLVVSLTGTGWPDATLAISAGWLPTRYLERGYAHAWISHRPMPRFEIADALDDYAAGLAKLREEAAERGFDPDRIVLTGQDFGAHFAALLAVDPSIVEARGVPFASIRGAILLEPPQLDLVDRIANGDEVRAAELRRLIGEDIATQRRLSPTAHLDAPNAPAFLIVRLERTASAAAGTDDFETALRETGSDVATLEVGRSHDDVLRSQLGASPHPGTATIDAFVGGVLGTPPWQEN